jgi:hypothetical protein
MGLREQAKLDARAILEDTLGFAWPVTLTSPLGVVTSVYGFTTDVGQTIDPETGQAVAGQRASCTVALGALPSLPEAVAEGSRKPWLATFADSQGVFGAWKVIEVLPDRAAGVVVLLLEVFKRAIVHLTGALVLPRLQLSGSIEPVVPTMSGELILPSLQLSGTIAPAVDMSGALALPSLQLSGTLAPAVQVSGSLALPSLQLSGTVAPQVQLSGALALPSLQLSGTLAPAVQVSGSLVLPSLQLSGSYTAFNPQIASATSQVFSTPSTAVTVTRPACNIGDRLLLLLCRSSIETDPLGTPSGWTAINASGLTGTASSFCRAYFQDVDAGNVGDTTVPFTGGTSTESTSLIWRLTGCDLSVAPVANGTLQNSNGVSTVNPTALTGPNGGAVQRNLWFVYLGSATQDSLSGATPVVTGFPATYGNTGTSTTTDAAAVANGCGQGWGSKIATAGSDDPSAWTYCPAAGARALAINIAVRGVQG